MLNEIDRLGKPGSGSFLAGLVDASRTGIIGYSMGGYGVVNVIGGGYSAASATFNGAPPNKMLAERGAANPEYRKTVDARIKAAIAIGPWGMQSGFWDAEGLKGIRTPVMFVAGSADETSEYEKGTRAIFQGAVNADRYLLDVHQRQPQRRGADSRAGGGDGVAAGRRQRVFALRRRRVGHDADEQHLRSLCDGVFRLASERRAGRCSAYLDVVPNGKDAVYRSIATASRRHSHLLEGLQARDRGRPDPRARRCCAMKARS